eukprot:scaffold1182_cov396-Prasinococcus_capsulatus_cf.AAC.11
MPPTSSRTTMISVPATTSGFSVDASTSCGRMVAGRRLAKQSRDPRSESRPCSGRSSGGLLSHLYPPMAAKRTASLQWRRPSVAVSPQQCAHSGTTLTSLCTWPQSPPDKALLWHRWLRRRATLSRTQT